MRYYQAVDALLANLRAYEDDDRETLTERLDINQLRYEIGKKYPVTLEQIEGHLCLVVEIPDSDEGG